MNFLLNPYAFVAAGPSDFYANSVIGNDANNGTTPELAFATLAAAQSAAETLGAGAAISLAKGSSWGESLNLSTVTPVTASVHGTGDVPVIDGADVVTAWTAEGTANVWQASAAHDGYGSERLTVYEDGALLTRVTTIALCSTTPGSFVNASAESDPTPWAIYIHPTGSGDPTSNGKVYEAAVRRYGLFVGDNAVVNGPVETSRVLGNNGAFEAGNNASIKRVLSVYGTKHNILISSGSIEDSIACRADVATSYEPSSTWYVFYDVDIAGLSWSMTRCGIAPDGFASGGNGLICHDSTGNSYENGTLTQVWTDMAGMSPQAKSLTVTGLYLTNNGFSPYTDNCTVKYLLGNQTVQPTPFTVGFRGATSATQARTILIQDCAFYSVADNDQFIRQSNAWDGCDIEFRNCVIYLEQFRPLWQTVGTAWSSGTLRINNCILVAGNTNSVQVPTGVTYIADNNVFVSTNRATFLANYNGSQITDLATWKSTTGQDANSVASNSVAGLFSGIVANGDFRLAGSGLGASAAALGAGPQSHWDWNARASASGPPTRWPVPPATLAESRTYVAAPASWDFYP